MMRIMVILSKCKIADESNLPKNTDESNTNKTDMDHDLQGNIFTRCLDAVVKLMYPYTATWVDIWIAGVTITIGGQMYGWNVALKVGFGGWIIAQVLMGLAYIIYLTCLAELQSAISFSGGSYAVAQVVLGYYFGFMSGCFELIEFTFMATTSVMYLGQTITSPLFLNCDARYQPIIWVLFYLLSLITILPQGKVFWWTSFLLGTSSIAIIIFYCAISLQYVNMSKYAPLHPFEDGVSPTGQYSGSNLSYWFVGGFSTWFSTLSYSTWAYSGVESLTLLTSYVKEPKVDIPYGMLASVVTLFATNILLVCVSSSIPPGLDTTSQLGLVMSPGYQLMFNWHEQAVSAIILPAQFAMAWGFILPTGKLLNSMARSNLLPSFLNLQTRKDHSVEVVIASFISFVFCLVSYIEPHFLLALQNIAILGAFLTYFCQLVIFYRMRTVYENIERNFHSPFHITGAVIIAIFFTFSFVSVAFFQNDGYVAIISVASLVVIFTLYYKYFLAGKQIQTKEEETAVNRLHIIKFNNRRARQMNNKKKSLISHLRSRLFVKANSVSSSFHSNHSGTKSFQLVSVKDFSMRPSNKVLDAVLPI